MSWNIERGYKPDTLVEYICQINPDIICLQEVDWGNERTSHLDILDYIARQTGMQGAFSPEFFELQTPHRTSKTAGGGVHGNAILSRLHFTSCYRIELPIIFDWENPPPHGERIAKREKRLGSRFALCAEIDCWQGKFTVCSTHLEDKGGQIDGRLSQLQHLIAELSSKTPGKKRIIAGDLNTIGNWLTHAFGITRSSSSKPWYVSECQWWKKEVLLNSMYFDPFSCKNWTLRQGIFYREKLDWVLLDNQIQCLGYGIGDFNSSDHRPIWVDVR